MSVSDCAEGKRLQKAATEPNPNQCRMRAFVQHIKNCPRMQRSWTNGHLLVMRPIIREIKNLLENAEPCVTVVGCTCDEPLAYPVGEALRLEYRQRNLDGIKVPPVDLKDSTDPRITLLRRTRSYLR